MRELPTGTVTFLFTDVEGSTRLLKQLRERYGEVLAEHHRILRAAFEQAGGHEIDTQGDSFFVAFRNARDAVAAAVAAQRALAQHAWPNDAELRVRMGIHTGEASLADERYLGVAVHRAARICAAGHGGQILISQITHDLLHDEEADLPGVEVRDLGEQRLRDLDRPVRLYQVVADGLPAEFPPLRTAERLPERGITPFAGQEGDLAEAAREAVFASRRRRLVPAVAGLVLVLAAAVAALAILRDDPRPPTVVAGSLVKLDPETGDVVDVFRVGAHPERLVVAGDSVWVQDRDDGTLSRLDTRTGEVARIGIAGHGLAPGPGSKVWVARRNPVGVSLVNGASMRVERTIRVRAPVAELVAVGGDSLWTVVPAPGQGRVEDLSGVRALALRIDPESGAVAKRIPVGWNAWAIGYGADALWVVNYRDAVVRRVDAADGSVTPIDVKLGPLFVTATDDGVWVAHFEAESVVRLAPDPPYDVEAVLNLRSPPAFVAVGERSVWVSMPETGVVHQLEPEGARVRRTIRIGHAPMGIAVGAGGVWLSVTRREDL